MCKSACVPAVFTDIKGGNFEGGYLTFVTFAGWYIDLRGSPWRPAI
jgi:hypothetical protein